MRCESRLQNHKMLRTSFCAGTAKRGRVGEWEGEGERKGEGERETGSALPHSPVAAILKFLGAVAAFRATSLPGITMELHSKMRYAVRRGKGRRREGEG